MRSVGIFKGSLGEMALSIEKWQERASKMIRAELLEKDCSYKELARRLARIGVDYDDRALANRVNRGSFTAVFFLQCLVALDVKRVDIPKDLFTG